MSAFWERGSQDLPACGLRRGSKGAQHGPSSSVQAQDPREGPSLAGQTTGGFLRHGLVRLAREEVERSRRGTSRGAHDASDDDRSQAAPGGHGLGSVLVSPLVQRGQAQAKASGKGCHSGATRPTSRAAGRRSPWSPRRRHHQSFAQTKTTFVRVASTSCPPSN